MGMSSPRTGSSISYSAWPHKESLSRLCPRPNQFLQHYLSSCLDLSQVASQVAIAVDNASDYRQVTYARRPRKRIDTIPADALEALTRYLWPRNVRALQNVIERAVILTPDTVLRLPPADRTCRRPTEGCSPDSYRAPDG